MAGFHLALLIILQAHQIDQTQLTLQIIGMVGFGIFQLDDQHLASNVILGLFAGGNCAFQFADHMVFQFEIGLEHFGNGVPNVKLEAIRQVRSALQEENAPNQRAGMLALVIGFVQAFFRQMREAFICVDFAVYQVLVDCG